MILLDVLSLNSDEDSVKNFKVFFTLICFGFLFDLFTIAKEAPLLNASCTNKFPFLFFPLIAKNISFFFYFFRIN